MVAKEKEEDEEDWKIYFIGLVVQISQVLIFMEKEWGWVEFMYSSSAVIQMYSILANSRPI